MPDVESRESRVAASGHIQAQSAEAATTPNMKPKFRRRADPEYNIFDRGILPSTDKYHLEMVDGVMRVFHAGAVPIGSTSLADAASSPRPPPLSCFPVPSFSEFVSDLWALKKVVFAGAISSFCYNRLELLGAKFHLHVLLNGEAEYMAQKCVPHR